MLRRSARHKVEEDTNRNPPDNPPARNAPPKKRTKKAVEPVNESTEIKPQRRRGKLRFITEMPLDILFEIFGQLLPLDILNLSRASKALRYILLRKSAAFVWKQAFLNVPYPTPPPCPDDLNAAQYANLSLLSSAAFPLRWLFGVAAFGPARIAFSQRNSLHWAT